VIVIVIVIVLCVLFNDVVNYSKTCLKRASYISETWTNGK